MVGSTLGEVRNSYPFSLKLIQGAAPALLLTCKILLFPPVATLSHFLPSLILCTSGKGVCGVLGILSPCLTLPASLLGMGCLNRDLCSPSLVSGRWGYEPALVPRWQQSLGYHSFSCLSVSVGRAGVGRKDVEKGTRLL